MERKRFTLMELCVVMAIVAILASLLIPTLAKARKASRTVLCTNNMKQIITASTMFSGDNNLSYPDTSSTTEEYTNRRGRTRTRTTGYTSWDDLLAGYDGRESLSADEQALTKLPFENFGGTYKLSSEFNAGSEIYVCPEASNKQPVEYTKMSQWGKASRQYAINKAVYGLKSAFIRSPSNTIAYTERNFVYLGSKDDSYTAQQQEDKLLIDEVGDLGNIGNHDAKTIYTMADGSIKAMIVTQTSNYWDTNN